MAKKQSKRRTPSAIRKASSQRKPKQSLRSQVERVAPTLADKARAATPTISPSLQSQLAMFAADLGKDPKRSAVFNSIYSETAGDWNATVAQLNNKKAFKGELLNKLEFTHQLAEWSDNNHKLVRAFQANASTNSMRDIATTFDRAHFIKLVSKEKAHGKDDTATILGDRLYNDLFQRQPTAMLGRMLQSEKESPIATRADRANVAHFLANQPSTFDIKTMSIYQAFNNPRSFDGIELEAHEATRTQLKSLQRVAALSPAPEVVSVLMRANVTSALMIGDMPESQFVESLAPKLGHGGEAVARQVHVNAVNARIRNEQALISMKEINNGTGVAFIDKSMRNGLSKGNELPTTLDQNNLSWDFLFGDADLCECGQCTSVYSASAYYVELLQYLRNNNLDPGAAGALAIHTDPKDISKTPLRKLFESTSGPRVFAIDVCKYKHQLAVHRPGQ